MNKQITFVTGNERKIGEAKLACEPMGISVKAVNLDIEEIQSNNPMDISAHKAKKAFETLKTPLVVTDAFWNIPALKGFPGAYMHEVADWFDSEDFISLMQGKNDRTILFSENITYIDSGCIKTFTKEFPGVITSSSRGTGNSIENVAEFDGVTLGERREQGGFSHKPEDYVWVGFAKWYLKHNS